MSPTEALQGIFIDVEVSDEIRDDPEIASKLEEVCPVDIYANEDGHVAAPRRPCICVGIFRDPQLPPSAPASLADGVGHEERADGVATALLPDGQGPDVRLGPAALEGHRPDRVVGVDIDGDPLGPGDGGVRTDVVLEAGIPEQHPRLPVVRVPARPHAGARRRSHRAPERLVRTRAAHPRHRRSPQR